MYRYVLGRYTKLPITGILENSSTGKFVIYATGQPVLQTFPPKVFNGGNDTKKNAVKSCAMVANCVSTRSPGLLARRGTSTSLTISLGQCESIVVNPSSPTSGNDLTEETVLRKPGRLTRYQLRHLDVLHSLPAIYAEFAMLPSSSTSLCEKVAGCSQKNRHLLWPIRKTRVRLSSSYRASCKSAAEDACQSYINANYIVDSKLEPVYIAAEGPMPNTVNDFWAMVFQERTPAIVMITNLEEKACGTGAAQKKCEKYWPENRNRYGKIDVAIVSTSFHGSIQIRHISLKCGDSEHHTKHIWFTEWLDHCLPVQHITQVLKVIVTTETYRSECQRLFSRSGPVVVHCSAGIGRTCTLIAIALAVDQLLKTPENIDVFSIVSGLRTQRFGAVQLPGQYAFIYLALQRMERLLAEFCTRNEQDKFPPCLTFSETCDNENSDPESGYDELICNASADLLCSSF